MSERLKNVALPGKIECHGTGNVYKVSNANITPVRLRFVGDGTNQGRA